MSKRYSCCYSIVNGQNVEVGTWFYPQQSATPPSGSIDAGGSVAVTGVKVCQTQLTNFRDGLIFLSRWSLKGRSFDTQLQEQLIIYHLSQSSCHGIYLWLWSVKAELAPEVSSILYACDTHTRPNRFCLLGEGCVARPHFL